MHLSQFIYLYLHHPLPQSEQDFPHVTLHHSRLWLKHSSVNLTEVRW